jgi:hypothetical protein
MNSDQLSESYSLESPRPPEIPDSPLAHTQPTRRLFHTQKFHRLYPFPHGQSKKLGDSFSLGKTLGKIFLSAERALNLFVVGLFFADAGTVHETQYGTASLQRSEQCPVACELWSFGQRIPMDADDVSD